MLSLLSLTIYITYLFNFYAAFNFMQPMTTIAARKAGDSILESFDRLDSLKIEVKQANDFVTQVDKRAEKIIIHALKKAYPDHGFLAEESGLQPGKGAGAEYQWVIDPLDGTTNFIHGVSHFAISIACIYRGRAEHAVVYDPVRDEAFCASRGHGASLNGCRIRVSGRSTLNGALLATGFPFREDQQKYTENYFNMVKAVSRGTAGVRRFGAAALDLAHVAAGRFDGFWELGLQPWDMAAGCLLVKESGGLLSDLQGGNNYYETGFIVCGTPKCFKEILTRIQPWADLSC